MGREIALAGHRNRSGKRVDEALVLLVAAFPLLLLIPIGHDQIWSLWIGRQLLHGAEIYRDIIEVNPPLWFWLAVPQAAIGEVLDVPSRVIVIAFFAGSIALSLLLTPTRYRLPALAAFIFLPLLDFGQREHFTFIVTAPYVFLIGQRMQRDRPRHPFVIGALAAFGFALKPYFVLVPVLLEFLLWRWPRVRPETVALGVGAVVYAAAVLFFAPAYLTEVVPMLRDYYGAIQGPSVLPAILTIFAIGLLGFALSGGKPTSIALLVASLGFLSAMIWQGKGWGYHGIPARGFLFLALTVELMRSQKPVHTALLATAAVLCFLPNGVYRNPFRAEIEQHLAGIPKGARVYFLAENPMVAWPMVEERGLEWGSRQMSLWQGVAASKGNERAKAAFLRMVGEDLARKPDLIVAPVGFVPGAKGYAPWVRTAQFVSLRRLAERT